MTSTNGANGSSNGSNGVERNGHAKVVPEALLQEIHDDLVAIAKKGGKIMLAARPHTSAQTTSTKNNSKSLTSLSTCFGLHMLT